MGPNYLQRIAIAGCRAGAAAKPAVIGPPQMPGSVWSLARSIRVDRPLPPGAVESEQPQSRPPLDPAQARPVGSSPDVQRSVDAKRQSKAELAPDVEPASPGEPIVARRSATGVEDGPRLQPIAAEEPRSPIPSVPRPANAAVITAPKGLRPIPKPPPPTDEPTPRLPADDWADGLAAQGGIRGALRSRTQSIIVAPQGLRPVLDPAPTTAHEPTVRLPPDAAPRTLSAESPVPAPPGIGHRPEAPGGDGSGPAQLQSPANAAAILSEDRVSAEPPLFFPDSPLERVETADRTRHTAAAPAAAAAPAPAAFIPQFPRLPVMPPNPASSTRDESRITIGRIEVQVNNRLPQLPAASRPEPIRVSRSASALLEAHYLDRFSLRP